MFLQELHAGDPFNERELTDDEREILDAQPELDADMSLVLEAWQECDSERYPGPLWNGKIPLRGILAWAEFNHLDYELAVMVIGAIRYLDSERLERLASEHANRSGGG